MMMIKVSLGSVLYQRATRTMAQMRLTADTPVLRTSGMRGGGEGWVTSTPPSSTPGPTAVHHTTPVGGGVMILGDGGGRIYSQSPDMS
jgi:hypothetical protein